MGFRRYDVVFQFDSRKPAKIGRVRALSMAKALDEAHQRLLGLRMIAVHGYSNGKLPRSVTVTRVGHPPRKEKGTAAST